jgi:hypothetical protein
MDTRQTKTVEGELCCHSMQHKYFVDSKICLLFVMASNSIENNHFKSYEHFALVPVRSAYSETNAYIYIGLWPLSLCDRHNGSTPGTESKTGFSSYEPGFNRTTIPHNRMW